MTDIDATFIRDIDPDPVWVLRMVNRIDEATSDSVSDFAWQIATDYVPAPDENSDIDAYEDKMWDDVVNPLIEHLTRHIIAKMITG